MFGSQTLEVIIGVISLFILMSIIISVIREGLESWLKTRAAFLERGIQELLNDKTANGLVNRFYNHPSISSLFFGDYTPNTTPGRPHSFSSGRSLPSYIPTKNFALALMDMAARGPAAGASSNDDVATRMTVDSIRLNVANLNNPPVQRVMLTALDAAQDDLDKTQAYLEAWYDSSMDRVSGWYRRSSQWVLFWIGLSAAIILNVNPITVAAYLSHNDVARAAVTARAQAAVKGTEFGARDYYAAKSELDSLSLPIGWSKGHGMALQQPAPGSRYEVWNQLLGPLIGWLLTALATTLGAPFWFDVLNKVMVIRSTVKPHEKSREEASQDRQLPHSQPEWKSRAAANTTNGVGPAAGGLSTTAQVAADESVNSIVQPVYDAANEADNCTCDLQAIEFTPDEDLPPAEGGVAQFFPTA